MTGHVDPSLQLEMSDMRATRGCPVCAYRVCSGCASVDIPNTANDNKNNVDTVEALFARQFKSFGKTSNGVGTSG